MKEDRNTKRVELNEDALVDVNAGFMLAGGGRVMMLADEKPVMLTDHDSNANG